MKAYKLVRKMKSGALRSLFIDKAHDLPIGKWMESECIPTKGYAIRPGWHVLPRPVAPHLKTEGRVWVEVEIKDFTKFSRPKSQGGEWLLAKHMRILGEV
jgi:hypothetical protein